MESLYFLIPIGIVLIAAAAGILLWAVRSGQYDDLDREASRILFEEDARPQTPDDENSHE
ncbi:MAG TPA: cbb3-type cytochrome oxidase assembly protein CcoS [Pseudomonadales bacterium]|jgi:cbb3-type cytochrome oxidase maturation protein